METLIISAVCALISVILGIYTYTQRNIHQIEYFRETDKVLLYSFWRKEVICEDDDTFLIYKIESGHSMDIDGKPSILIYRNDNVFLFQDKKTKDMFSVKKLDLIRKITQID